MVAVAVLLVSAVTITGAGLWAGIDIACASHKYEDACESFDAGFPTISMLMHHRRARAVMRGCFGAGSVLNLGSDLGLSFVALRPGPCAGLAGVAAVGSFVAILVGISTNPRGAPHVTACVLWAFLRIAWGLFVLRAVWADAAGVPAFLRLLFGAALAGLGFRLAATAHSGNMPGHLEVVAVAWMLAFEVTLLPEAAGCVRGGDAGRVLELPRYSS